MLVPRKNYLGQLPFSTILSGMGIGSPIPCIINSPRLGKCSLRLNTIFLTWGGSPLLIYLQALFP